MAYGPGRRVTGGSGSPSGSLGVICGTASCPCCLSDGGVPVEHILRLVGHSGTSVTELVYRVQIRPVLDNGATTMDRILPRPSR